MEPIPAQSKLSALTATYLTGSGNRSGMTTIVRLAGAEIWSPYFLRYSSEPKDSSMMSLRSASDAACIPKRPMAAFLISGIDKTRHRSLTVPTENSISANKDEVQEPWRANHSVCKSIMIASLAAKQATCQLLRGRGSHWRRSSAPILLYLY